MNSKILLFTALLISGFGFAQSGSPSATFGSGGSVTFNTPAFEFVRGMAVQSDGKIVVAGLTSASSAQYDFLVARLNTNGTPDNSFGNGGFVISSVASDLIDEASCVAIQMDGKIVIAGRTGYGPPSNFALLRYLPNGVLDNTFDGDGIVTTDFANDDNIMAIVIQPDGKIIASGYSHSTISGSVDFSVARYNPDGTLDNTFDSDGKVTTDIGGQADYALGMTIQNDGKILVVGTTLTAGDDDFAIVRYNGNGTLDNSFSDDGKVITSNLGLLRARDVEIQDDGKIVVTGNSSSGLVVVRYTTEGLLDNSFGSDGITTPILGNGVGVEILENGKIIAGGQIVGPNNGYTVVRLNSDGSLDDTFHDDGISLITFNGQHEALAFDYFDDNIYVAGYAGDYDLTVAAFVINDETIEISCPSNQVVNAPEGTCIAFVNGIDPTVIPGESAINYSLTGATTGNGAGTASGLTFNVGVTTVTYSSAVNPSINCSFTVTVLAPAPVIDCPVDIILNCNEATDICRTGVATALASCSSLQQPGISTGIASAFSGPEILVPGFGPPQGTARPYNTAANLAFSGNGLAKPAVAKDVIPGFGAIHSTVFANDGYYGNGRSWISNSGTSWIKIDLGMSFTINQVNFGRDRVGAMDDRDPGAFSIWVANCDDIYANGNEANDLTEYDLVFSSFDYSFNGLINGLQTIQAKFPSINARYVKILFANAGVAIDEIEVFQSPVSIAYADQVVAGTGNIFQVIQRTWTATDANGSSQCMQQISIRDEVAPSFVCPSAQNVTLNENCSIIIPDLISVLTGSDNCGTVSFMQVPAAGTVVPSSHNQAHEVAIIASDGHGNTASCSVNLTAKDQSLPTLDCPDDIMVLTDAGTCGAVVNYTIGQSDNCGAGFQQTGGLASGAVFPVGTTVNTFTLTDAAGNSVNCSFSVTVNAREEVCNGIDDDCDGQVDEGFLTTYYQDSDNDGFGNPDVSQQACSAPAGFVNNDYDCDDTRNTVYPGANEICDGLDNDCDGQVDEAGLTLYYQDSDNDGFGNASVSQQACSAPAGFVSNADDCDDTRNTVYPGANEICDGFDNDCDGQIEETGLATFYQDNDNDGYGSEANGTIQACSAPAGYVSSNTDCNDNNAAINPGATEQCNGVNDDCDGQTDEGCANLPRITIRNTSVREGNSGTRNAGFSLLLNRAYSQPVTVNYQTVNVSANAPSDYLSQSGTITFPANITSHTLNIQVAGDVLREPNEIFRVQLSNPVNATLSNSYGVGTIINDDPLVQAVIHDTTVYESDDRIYIRVSLSAPSGQVVRVRYSTQNGTASSPFDYAGVSNIMLTFAPGVTTQYASVIVKNDTWNEQTEYFNVRLVSAENATLGSSTRTARVTLLNGTDNSLTKGKPQMEEHEIQSLEVKAWPNPAAGAFILQLTSNTAELITIKVTDVVGSPVARIEKVQPNSTIKIGAEWRSGIYLAEIIQGRQRKTLKLIRQN